MNLKIYFTFLTLLFLFTNSTLFSQKSFEALKIREEPIIDGVLDDKAWTRLNKRIEFTEFDPRNGKPSGYYTSVDIVYTDKGIYIAAKLFDPNPAEVPRELAIRDDDNRNADEFGVLLDTYNNGLNAFYFKVSAAGVQTDMYFSGNGADKNWDAVWNSAVTFDKQGWNVEMEIPYYALRFSSQEEQVWGLNFYRENRKDGKESFWNPVDNSVRGLVNQSGKLTGLTNLKPPLRLSFLPYITTLFEKTSPESQGEISFSGGMDLKYGINESFTLDVSLIPDFSQVRSDDQVLNLSPFEVRFSENRPFFTENIDIFDRGGLFYSRRVGQSNGLVFSPGAEANVVSTPGNAPLINAIKFSGRTNKGTGIGIFNGLTRRTYAEVEVPLVDQKKIIDVSTGDSVYQVVQEDVLFDPLTNYNVLVVDQNLKNNSNIGLINTNVMRSDGGRDANVTSADASIYDNSNTYRFGARVAASMIFEKNENGEEETDLGHRYAFSFSKVSGQWQYRVSRNVESDNYRINDLGFIRAANEVSHNASVSYNVFQPFSVFNSMSHGVYFNHDALYKPSAFSSYDIGLDGDMQFGNFWGIGYRLNVSPQGENDYFESRRGIPFKQPDSWNYNLRMYSDSRKPLFVNAWGGRWFRPDWDQNDYWLGTFARYRVNDKLSLSYRISRNESRQDIGFVRVNDKVRAEKELDQQKVIFGNRDISNTENNVAVTYNFTNKMGLNMRVRHLWTTVDYNSFYYLEEGGNLTNNDYNGEGDDGKEVHNINFNAFNVDFNFSWQVAPGSFFTVAWRNNSIFSTSNAESNFSDNLSEVMSAPHNNNLSFRLTYFIDYMSLKRSI